MNITTSPTAKPPVDPSAVQLAQARLRLENQICGGASWFFWIAGLSVVNTILVMTNANLQFMLGLGFTQFISGIAMGAASQPSFSSDVVTIINVVAFVLNLAISAVFIVFGIFGRKARRWAFIVGMIVYLLDAVLFILFADWRSLIFHVIALVGLFSGMSAINKLKKFDQAQAAAQGQMYNQPPTISPV